MAFLSVLSFLYFPVLEFQQNISAPVPYSVLKSFVNL